MRPPAFRVSALVGTRALSITSGTLSLRVRHEPCAFTAIRRPALDIIETEVLHVVQGVAETASKRSFRLGAIQPLDQAADLHAAPAAR